MSALFKDTYFLISLALFVASIAGLAWIFKMLKQPEGETETFFDPPAPELKPEDEETEKIVFETPAAPPSQIREIPLRQPSAVDTGPIRIEPAAPAPTISVAPAAPRPATSAADHDEILQNLKEISRKLEDHPAQGQTDILNEVMMELKALIQVMKTSHQPLSKIDEINSKLDKVVEVLADFSDPKGKE